MRPFDWEAMWVPEWPPWEVMLRAAIIYLVVYALLRVIGRRELGRYSTSDILFLFLISVAVRQSIVGLDTSLTSAIVGFGTLLALDWLFAVLSFRSQRASKIIEGQVRQLMRDGELLERELRRALIDREVLVANLRHQHGLDDLGAVRHAFLGIGGEISFVLWKNAPPRQPDVTGESRP